MDFKLADKHKREVEQRRKEAKRKLEQQKRDEELKAAMEAAQRAREEERVREAEEERRRREEEASQNDGIRYCARLRPYPSARTDDKLELPPSALEALARQEAIDPGSLLTFAVALPASPATAQVGVKPARTHAGVAEFTAEEGTVGVPPRVALCLTKGAGLESLASVGQVEVRFARLPRCAKSKVTFQPRGQGFHAGGMRSAYIDLEHVLQETLRGHTALTEGDWLPIRHGGTTYELVVRELEPEPQLALLDTDLTVEVLPSEQTEAELRAKREAEERAELRAREAAERERQRLERCRLKALALPPEPPAGPEAVQLLLRLPDGTRLQRRFERGQRLEQVLNWVESEPSTRVSPGDFRVVQKWPGHCRELGPAEASETLAALNFARQEALFLQLLGQEAGVAEAPAEDDAATVQGAAASTGSAAAPSAPSAPSRDGAWAEAQRRAHAALDRRLEGEEPEDGGDPAALAAEPEQRESLKGAELVAVFERLVALGMRPQAAASASKRFAAQLKELGEMGFEDWVAAVELLERYNGRLLRVANLLSERAGGAADMDVDVREASPSTPPAAVPAATAAPPSPPAAPISAQVPAPQADVSNHLQELAAMGFTDEARNRELLRKYAGRLERVVEALCSS